MQVSDLIDFIRGITEPTVATVRGIHRRATGASDRNRPGLSQSRSADDHIVRRRVAAREDGEAPRQQPHRHDVHLRRAERRPARARRAAGQRAAAAIARQGQHRARRRARPGRHRHRRSHRRSGPARGQGRWRGGVPGHARRAGAREHVDGPCHFARAAAEFHAAHSAGVAAATQRLPAQSPRCERRHSEGSHDGGRGCRGLWKKLVDQRGVRAPLSRNDLHRSGRVERIPAFQHGDLHGAPRSDPQSFRRGQRRERHVVQCQLRRRLSAVQRPGHDHTRSRVHGSDREHLRGVSWKAVHARGAAPSPSRQEHSRSARYERHRGARVLRASRHCARRSNASSKWVSGTCRWASP